VPDIPVQSLALLVGIDKFMSECRALTNLIGNGVATLVISRWERELDLTRLREVMGAPARDLRARSSVVKKLFFLFAALALPWASHGQEYPSRRFAS